MPLTYGRDAAAPTLLLLERFLRIFAVGSLELIVLGAAAFLKAVTRPSSKSKMKMMILRLCQALRIPGISWLILDPLQKSVKFRRQAPQAPIAVPTQGTRLKGGVALHLCVGSFQTHLLQCAIWNMPSLEYFILQRMATPGFSSAGGASAPTIRSSATVRDKAARGAGFALRSQMRVEFEKCGVRVHVHLHVVVSLRA